MAPRTVEVLIVDDQAPFRSVARMLVGMIEGWQVVGEAHSGEEALELAVQARPTIVLMDIHMSGIDGVEATRRLRAKRPEIKVVLLSSYHPDDLPPEVMSCGAAAYICKDDLTPARLTAVLDQPT